MTEDELRALVRDAIERHLKERPAFAKAPAFAEASAFARRAPADRPGGKPADPPEPRDARLHPSHVRLAVESGSQGEGRCLIEPAVACVHCGFCQSFGH